MLLLYAIVAWVAIRSWPVVFSKEGGANRMIVAGFWAACAAYMTHLFFGLSVTGTSFLLWVSMAVVVGPTASSRELRRPSWGIAAAAVVTLLVLAGIFWQVRFTAADNAYLRARVATEGAARTQAAQRAVALNPYNDIYRAEVGLAYFDEMNGALTAATSGDQAAIDTVRSAFANAEASFRDTISFVPWEYDNYVFLSNLYNLGGQVFGEQYDKQAIETARQGVAVEPYGAAVRVQYARALDTVGDVDGAIEQLTFALKLDPRYTEASLMLALLHEGQGRLDEAIKVLRDSAAMAPGDQNIASALQRVEASASAAATTTP